jgi:hypothetical protein
MTRLLMLILIVFSLASCQVLGGDDDDNGDSNGGNDGAVIQWDRSPSTIVFRADVTGGDDAGAFYTLNEVPPCTIYGDGTVVWVDDGLQVLFDDLDDTLIRSFVDLLTVYYGIYSYGAEADNQVITEVEPVIETLQVNVNGIQHLADSYSGWDGDYFITILNACRELSLTPTIFVPESAWLSVQDSPYSSNAPFQIWNAEASGLDLTAITASGEPLWVTGRNVRVLWNFLRASAADLQIAQGEGNYQIALQIPNVTRDAPQPPSE